MFVAANLWKSKSNWNKAVWDGIPEFGWRRRIKSEKELNDSEVQFWNSSDWTFPSFSPAPVTSDFGTVCSSWNFPFAWTGMICWNIKLGISNALFQNKITWLCGPAGMTNWYLKQETPLKWQCLCFMISCLGCKRRESTRMRQILPARPKARHLLFNTAPRWLPFFKHSSVFDGWSPLNKGKCLTTNHL